MIIQLKIRSKTMDLERFVKYLIFFGVFVGSFAEVRGSRIRTRHMFPKNFITLRYNTHNEKELRIAFNKILSLETTLPLSGYSDLLVVMKQATDGRRLVQSVYQGGYIKECDYSKDPEQVLDFVADFILPGNLLAHEEQFGNVFESYGLNNVSYNHTVAFQYFKRRDFLKDFASLVDFKSLVKKCRSFYKVAKTNARSEAHALNHDSDSDSNMDYSSKEKFNIIPTADNSENEIYRHRISKRSTEPIKKSRSKRSAFDFNSVLIFPGTKWCGKGDLAECFDDLGPDQELDTCCRDHDCCPFMIPPFTSRFNLFNYRFHSIIHCDCDTRFRGCLRQSLSTTANMIGKIYFNILGSKCFIFEEQEVCVERSWWGRCRKYESQLTAMLQSQGSFHNDDDYSNRINNKT